MLTLHRSKRIVVCIPLVLVVLLAMSCAPAATPTPAPLPTEPAATPTSEVVASLTVAPTATSPAPEKVVETVVVTNEVPVEVTKIVEKEVVVTQRINDLSQLPFGQQVEHVEVAYFHRTQRCEGCIEAERLIRKTLDVYFADRLKSGEMSLVVADVQKPQNAALVRKYDALSSFLYLGIVKGGIEYTWPVIDIWLWLTLSDEAEFMASLRDKINIVYRGY